MNVLSLFDGISCGQIALSRSGIKVNNYYSSEIEKTAISVTQKNYPDTIQMGDVRGIDGKSLSDIDLLLGGSPCQGFSTLGSMLNFNDDKSILFFEYCRILKEINPKYFLLENVYMKKEWRDIISEHLGVESIEINSSMFSPQNRKRLYWTNIPIAQMPNNNEMVEFKKEWFNEIEPVPFVKKKIEHFKDLPDFFNPYNLGTIKKAPTLTSQGNRQTISAAILCKKENKYFMANANYWEYLQTIPSGYTDGYSEAIRKNLIGNAWTVNVIAHILKGLYRIK